MDTYEVESPLICILPRREEAAAGWSPLASSCSTDREFLDSGGSVRWPRAFLLGFTVQDFLFPALRMIPRTPIDPRPRVRLAAMQHESRLR